MKTKTHVLQAMWLWFSALIFMVVGFGLLFSRNIHSIDAFGFSTVLGGLARLQLNGRR